MKLAVMSLVLCSCSQSITPAQHVQNLKAEIAVVKLACRVYEMSPSLPRDEDASRDCSNLLNNRQPVDATSAEAPR